MRLLSTTALSGPCPAMMPGYAVLPDPSSSMLYGPRSYRSDIVPQPYRNPHPADWLDWGFKRRGRVFINGEWREVEVRP